MELPSLDTMVLLLVMVVLARVAGELLVRRKQSPVAGEVLVGILLGPYVLGLVDPARDPLQMAEIRGIAELGVFFLIFNAGVELSMRELGRSMRRAVPTILGGLAIPFMMVALASLALGLPVATAAFLGLVFSLTALPVSVRLLGDLGKMRSVTGQTIVATAVGTDVGAMVMLAVLLNLSAGGGTGPGEIAWSIGLVVGFLAVVYIFSKLLSMRADIGGRDRAVLPHYLGRMVRALHSRESLFAVVILFVLLFGGLSELMGLDFIIGAFFGALLISRELLGRRNYERVAAIVSAISMGFIAPIFFVYVGLSFRIGSAALLYLIPVFLVLRVVSKYGSGWLGASAIGFKGAPAHAVATGLVTSGTLDIIIADLGVQAGLITVEQFSMIVFIVMVLLLAVPLALRRAYAGVDPEDDVEEPAGPEGGLGEDVLIVEELQDEAGEGPAGPHER